MASDEDDDLDRLVDLVTERVRARLGQSLLGEGREQGTPQSNAEPCVDDSREDCTRCGACVIRRPWSVRAIESAGASRVSAPAGVSAPGSDLARLIDHTLLKPEATRDEIVSLCDEARHHHFASVCVNTTWVPLAKALLANSDVIVCAVVGFPLGAMTPTAKAYEAREAVRQGAGEIDMVINIGALKSRDYETVLEDITRVVRASAPAGVKVILECASLTDDEKIAACVLAKAAGAAFVKTSTGFGKGGATVEDVALMRRIVGGDMGVKASGGVRSADDVRRMTEAGATRIGASASVAIVSGASSSSTGSTESTGGGAPKGY